MNAAFAMTRSGPQSDNGSCFNYHVTERVSLTFRIRSFVLNPTLIKSGVSDHLLPLDEAIAVIFIVSDSDGWVGGGNTFGAS